MSKKIPIFYNTLLLTGVNLLLRLITTSFQVYLSGKIGAAGIGLLQLVLSVGGLSLTVGMAGIRTATMYLCAEIVGKNKNSSLGWVLSSCLLYSILFSTATGSALYLLAPKIAKTWIGDSATTGAIRLLASYLPVSCLCGVMTGYYTARNKIRTLAAVEIVEQFCSMAATVLLLTYWGGNSPAKACQAVILGSGIGTSTTLLMLVFLKGKKNGQLGKRTPIKKKLLDTAIPLAIADNVKAGISTVENLMVPKRLGLYLGNSSALAAFGIVCGMVFPVLFFPAAILFALAELLIPELARCNAARSIARIQYLAERSLQFALIYGSFCGGILFLSAPTLCKRLYHTADAGNYLQWFSVLAPMLYCDAITDAITKGLGQQKICVINNIITSALDVVLLFILLPKYGMRGYFASFLITHLLNFCLSIQLLLQSAGKIIHFKTVVLCMLATTSGVIAAIMINNAIMRYLIFTTVFITLLFMFGIVKIADIKWIKQLIR